jgi:hypothetical protein
VNPITAQNLAQLEQQMAVLQAEIGSGQTDSEKLKASDEFEALLKSAFESDGIMDYSFDQLGKMAVLSPKDGSFRIFNWNIPLDNETYVYRMYVLFSNGGFTRFNDTGVLNQKLHSKTIEPENWYGALYYELKEVKQKKKTYYTLLGWDGNNTYMR